jgi:ribosomal protein L11
MAKKVKTILKLQIKAAAANPAPPVVPKVHAPKTSGHRGA